LSFFNLLQEGKMKRFAYFLLVGSVLAINAPAFAENRAVNINIGSIGGPLDDAALQTVRQVIGYAVARSTVDTFIVFSPRVGSPIPIEGGLSACAEAGFNTKKKEFNAFVRELRSIHPKPGTFFNLQPTASCIRDADVVCTLDVKLCPDGSSVGRVPPSCEFAPCPGE
jgi:hypothetical protein